MVELLSKSFALMNNNEEWTTAMKYMIWVYANEKFYLVHTQQNNW